MKHTINLQPDADILDGRNLLRLLDLWLESCRARLPEDTVQGYAYKLDYFRQWWTDVGPWRNWELTEDALLSFEQWLASTSSDHGKPLAYHTRKDVLRRLRSVLRWAQSRGYTDRRDFTAWVPQPSGSAPLRTACTLDDLRRLMDSAGASPTPLRDKAVVALFIGTGIRLAECAALAVTDITLDADSSGSAVIRHAKRVKGRQVQGRIIAIDAWTGRHLLAYLDSLPTRQKHLWSAYEQRPASEKTIYRIVKRAILRAGLADKLQGPHDLRRNFATWYSRTHPGEAEAHVLSKQLGHAQYSMTARYSLLDASDLRRHITSPLAGDEDALSQPQ